VEETDDGLVFTTKGDANAVVDDYTVSGGDLIGVVVFSSLFLGKLVHLMSNPLIFFPLLILPLAALLLANLWSTVKLARQAAKEEEEAAIREIMEKRRASGEGEKPE